MNGSNNFVFEKSRDWIRFILYPGIHTNVSTIVGWNHHTMAWYWTIRTSVQRFQWNCISNSKCFSSIFGKQTIKVLRFPFFSSSQEYKRAIDILRRAYFSNTSTIDVIRRANIEFQSDLIMYENVLKAVMFQANANQRRKNTYLFRWFKFDSIFFTCVFLLNQIDWIDIRCIRIWMYWIPKKNWITTVLHIRTIYAIIFSKLYLSLFYYQVENLMDNKWYEFFFLIIYSIVVVALQASVKFMKSIWRTKMMPMIWLCDGWKWLQILHDLGKCGERFRISIFWIW